MARVLKFLDRTLSCAEVAYLFVEDKPILARETGIHNLVSVVVVVNDLASATALITGRADDDRARPPTGFAGFHRITSFRHSLRRTSRYTLNSDAVNWSLQFSARVLAAVVYCTSHNDSDGKRCIREPRLDTLIDAAQALLVGCNDSWVI